MTHSWLTKRPEFPGSAEGGFLAKLWREEAPARLLAELHPEALLYSPTPTLGSESWKPCMKWQFPMESFHKRTSQDSGHGKFIGDGGGVGLKPAMRMQMKWNNKLHTKHWAASCRIPYSNFWVISWSSHSQFNNSCISSHYEFVLYTFEDRIHWFRHCQKIDKGEGASSFIRSWKISMVPSNTFMYSFPVF